MPENALGGPLTWNANGVLPSLWTDPVTGKSLKSPYLLNIRETWEHFALSPEREQLLLGLIKFREALYEAGIRNGIQWIDGSFVEHIEGSKGRPPRDIDVVTLFELPEGEAENDFIKQHACLFDKAGIKQTYKIDAYFFVLGKPADAHRVRLVTYWQSQWSHRRDGTCKGFISVPLNPELDREVDILQKMGD